MYCECTLQVLWRVWVGWCHAMESIRWRWQVRGSHFPLINVHLTPPLFQGLFSLEAFNLTQNIWRVNARDRNVRKLPFSWSSRSWGSVVNMLWFVQWLCRQRTLPTDCKRWAEQRTGVKKQFEMWLGLCSAYVERQFNLFLIHSVEISWIQLCSQWKAPPIPLQQTWLYPG